MKPESPFDSDSNVEDRELERTREELAGLFADYRRDVLEELEPSAAHRAAMHRMMLGLVTEDVLARRPRLSPISFLSARWQRFCDCWRDLAGTSLAFRLTSQFALALGVGLVLSILTLASIDQGSRADDLRREQGDELLVPDSRGFELTIPRHPDPEDPVPASPAEEDAASEDPFGEGR